MAPQGPPGSYSPQIASGSRNPPHIEYTKAIAHEVRVLLGEIGRLRDERRQLQYEIAELMAVRTKFGPAGEFQPEWRPPAIEAPPPPEPLPAIEEAPPQAKPAWRTVHKRTERKARTVPKIAAPPPPMPPPPPEPVREMPSWTQWRPNPLLVPTPSMAAPAPMANSPPPRTGLFGPSTPPPK